MFTGKQVALICGCMAGLCLCAYWASMGPELPPFWPIALLMLASNMVSAFCGLAVGCLGKVASSCDETRESLEEIRG